jgi:hypothetical protein
MFCSWFNTCLVYLLKITFSPTLKKSIKTRKYTNNLDKKLTWKSVLCIYFIKNSILCRVCRVQGLSCPGFVMSSVCRVQDLSCPGFVCAGFVVSRVCHVKGLSCPGFVMSRVCRVQGLSCPGFVMSRVCLTRVCHVQGLSCPGFVCVSFQLDFDDNFSTTHVFINQIF